METRRDTREIAFAVLSLPQVPLAKDTDQANSKLCCCCREGVKLSMGGIRKGWKGTYSHAAPSMRA